MRYWKRIDAEGKTTTVESYSHGLDIEEAVEITKQEFDDYIAALPVIEFEPIVFTPINPLQGVEQRLTHVEQFLQDRYPSP